MNWFSILKVLGTKSGYAQLDFDSIAEEEESNCKKRWQQICDELSKVRIEGYTNSTSGSITEFHLKNNPTGYGHPIGHVHYGYAEEFPEEVYCKALEMLEAGINGAATVGDYRVAFFKRDNPSFTTNLKCYASIDPIDFKAPYRFAFIGYFMNPNRHSLKGLDMDAEVEKLLPKLKEVFPY